MVVILIIGILSGIVLTAMGGGDEERKLNAATSQVRSLFSLGQSASIARKEPIRVLIHADPADEDRYLRFFTLVYEDEDTGEWLPYTQGEFLPDGIYFTPAMSTGSGTSDPDLQVWELGFNPDTLEFSSPGSVSNAGTSSFSGNVDPVSDAGTDTWFMYEFLSNGKAESPMSRVVLAAGLMDNDQIRFTNPDADPFEMARGFVIFRSGKIMFFQDAEQIRGS